MVPRWVRASVYLLLVRMESAIGSLVFVAAVTVCGYRGEMQTPVPAHGGGMDLPTARLLRQIARLQAILEDLPGHARRLIRRMVRSNAVEPQVTPPLVRDDGIARIAAPYSRRIERPPIAPRLSLLMI